MVSKSNIYLNSERNYQGSQSEIPHLSMINNEINIGGYQQFCITKNNIIFKSKINKYNILQQILISLQSECITINDIGCNNGIISVRPFIRAHVRAVQPS